MTMPNWVILRLKLILRCLMMLSCQWPQVRAKKSPVVAPTNFPLAFCWQIHAMASASRSVNPHSICFSWCVRI